MSLEKEKTQLELANERSFKLPDFKTFKPPKIVSGGHRGNIRHISWSSDSRKLASCASTPYGTENNIRVWTPERNTDVRASLELKGHADLITRLAWDPTQTERLASVSYDRTLKFWDIRSSSKSPTSSLSFSAKQLSSTFHPSGNLIATSDTFDSVTLIDTRMNKSIGFLMEEGKIPTSKIGSTKGINSNLSNGNGGFIARNGFKSNNLISEEKEEINEISFSNDGGLFCMALSNGNIRMFDSRNLEFLKEKSLENGINTSIIDGGNQEKLEKERKDDDDDDIPWEIIMDFRAHSANVFCMAFENGGRYMATSAAEATVGIWDTKEFMSVATNSEMEHTARDMSFSGDGEILAAGGEDRNIFLMSTINGETIHKIPTTGINSAVAWHPTKYLLAYGGEEKDQFGNVGIIKLFGLER